MKNQNQGMFLEALINKTNNHYLKNNQAIIHKRTIDISISQIQNHKISGYLTKKSYVDYYGFANGRHFEFEAKSTKLDKLPLVNIKNHQFHYLQLATLHGAIAFYIIYFKKFKQFYLVDQLTIAHCKEEKIKAIGKDFCKQYGYQLTIIYPGVLDYLPHLQKLLL